jgi:predicted nucleic acid-binding protein
VSATVVLNAGPLGDLCNPRPAPAGLACQQWAAALRAAGRRVIVPEITDYEIRRELIRAGRKRSLALLDGLAARFEYLPLDTAMMRRAAELWAQARQQGRPTAGDQSLDADAILAAQALSLGVPVIVATANVAHLSRFVPADVWQNIPP